MSSCAASRPIWCPHRRQWRSLLCGASRSGRSSSLAGTWVSLPALAAAAGVNRPASLWHACGKCTRACSMSRPRVASATRLCIPSSAAPCRPRPLCRFPRALPRRLTVLLGVGAAVAPRRHASSRRSLSQALPRHHRHSPGQRRRRRQQRQRDRWGRASQRQPKRDGGDKLLLGCSSENHVASSPRSLPRLRLACLQPPSPPRLGLPPPSACPAAERCRFCQPDRLPARPAACRSGERLLRGAAVPARPEGNLF